MKLRSAFIFLLIVATLLTGCGKDEKIEGKVQDIFGSPLKDVTVKIQTSTFSAITDKSGSYSLDYAPGSMKLIFSKEGYTTGILDLSIQQKTYFPAEMATLSPIPPANGIFYVDAENKRLVKIEENGTVERSQINVTSYGYGERYVVKFFNPILTVKTGKAIFIDRLPPEPISDMLPDKIMPTIVKENGLIHEHKADWRSSGETYSGFLKYSSAEIGVEKLIFRVVELSSGSYAWVKITPSLVTSSYEPKDNAAAFGFQVEDKTAKESKSPDALKPKFKETQTSQQSEEIKTPNTNQQTVQTPPTESSATTTVAPAPASPTIDKADAVAVVNGQYITKSALTELEKEVAARGQGQSFPKEKLIEELVQRQLLIQDAFQKKLDQSTEFITQFEATKNTLLTQADVQNYLKTNPVTDAELKEGYDSKVDGKQLKSLLERKKVQKMVEEMRKGATVTLPTDKDDVVAIVNGQNIAKSALADLEKEVAARGQGQSFPKEKLIEELVQRQLLIQDALQKKLDQSPEVHTQLEGTRNSLLTQAALENYLKTTPVTDAELKAEYVSNVGGTEYKASHILVKTEDEAKRLVAELDKGGKFADLANKHSLDARKSQNGGDLGWFAANQMVKPFSEAVAKLEKGKYSKEPVKTQFGYHIILREDSRAKTPPSFDAFKEQLKTALERKKVQKMVEDMRKQAKVEILVSLVDEKPPVEPIKTTATMPTSAPEKTQAETTEAPAVPIHKQGDTYTLESSSLDSNSHTTTERKVIFANSKKLITESKNIKSKSERARKLEYTPEWNLTAIRNIDGSGVNYSPPLKYYEFPLASGKTWRQTSIETNIKTGAVREHTLSATVGDWENVNVPAGRFRGIRVTIQTELFDRTTGKKSTGTDTSWYVPEVRRSVRSLTSAKSPEGVESKQDIQLIKYDLIK